METGVIIVGGGLSGLHTARTLHERGVDFLLVEARDRIGGRIFSVHEGRDGYDALIRDLVADASSNGNQDLIQELMTTVLTLEGVSADMEFIEVE